MLYTMEYHIARSRTDPAHLVIEPDLQGFTGPSSTAPGSSSSSASASPRSTSRIKALIPFADTCKAPPGRSSLQCV